MAAANVIGYLEYDAAARKLKALRLVTDQGKFDRMDLGVAVRSVSEPQ
jgi:hypothetical protein